MTYPGALRMLLAVGLLLSVTACQKRTQMTSTDSLQGAAASAATAPAVSPPQVPRSRAGRNMLGKPLPLDGLRWLNTTGDEPVKIKGKVTLVRWWTDTCPFCRGSLPAIEKLRNEYGRRGFQSVAVYHAKPPRPMKRETILRSAQDFGYRGPVASDQDWETLKRLYLSTGRRSATSVSFLLDRQGIVRFVHPGPEFRPSEKAAETQLNQDYEDIKAAIEALLGQKS